MAISQVTPGQLTTLKHDLHRQQLARLSQDSLSEPLLPPARSHLRIQNSQLLSNIEQDVFKPGGTLCPPSTSMPRERYFSSKEEGRRLGVKQRKPFEDTLAIDVNGSTSKINNLHASSGFQGFLGGHDLCSEPRLHEAAALLDRKYEALYQDAGVNSAEKFESSVMPARALYNGFAEQLVGHSNPRAPQMAAALGYPRGDARIPPPALTLLSPVTPEMAGPRSLKTVDPLTLSRILLDQQVVAMAQMQQLRILQHSYIASGNPLYLLPENLMSSADLEVLWHLKHPGLPLPPSWTTLPWFQDDSVMGADLRLKEAYLQSKDMRQYQNPDLRCSKLEKPKLTDPGLPLEGVERTRFLREGAEASEMARTAADFMPGSDCHSTERKCRERKTFMENEKLGFSVDRVKRDRRWWKMESKSGISEHPHQQSWSEAGATEPSSQLQRNYIMPGFRQSDRKPEVGRSEGGCTTDYRKYDWPPDGRASLNQERTRKPSENGTPPDALQVGPTRPSSDPHLRNYNGLHPHNTGYAFSDRSEEFFIASERLKNGHPPPPDWFSNMEHVNQHMKNMSQFPTGVYKGRTTHRYSEEHVPTDIAQKSPTISEAMLQRGNSEMKVLSSTKNPRHSLYPHNRHMNGTANGTSLESRDGIGHPETGCGFVSPQNAARDFFFLQQNSQQAALNRFSASESQRLVTHDNHRGLSDDWEMTEAAQKRFYNKIPKDVPYDFPGIPYSGSTGASGRYSTLLDGHSSSSVGVSSPSNCHGVYSHSALALRLQMPSLSPITSCDALQSRTANHWSEGTNSKNTKKLKLDLPRTVNSPLPSWMNKSTFSALSTNSIDSFKSFVDHTVQNAFMNEMKEAESYSAAKANETKSKTEKALEDYSAGHSRASRNCPGEVPVADAVVLTASSMDSLASHPLSTETSPLLVAESVPCRQATPTSAGSDPGLLLQTGETGVHTKFKKTWLLNYLDQDRKLDSDSGAEYRQCSDAEMSSSKDCVNQSNDMDDRSEELPVNGNNNCATDSVIELIDLSSTKKLNQA